MWGGGGGGGGGGGRKKIINKKLLTCHGIFFVCFVLIFSELFFPPETVKLVIGKPTDCIKSLNILSFS